MAGGKVYVDVDRMALIQIIEDEKKKEDEEYERALVKYEADLEKFRVAAKKALEKALEDVDRIEENYRGFTIKGFPSKPSKPTKPTHARHDGNLKLLNATSVETVKITPNSDFARYF